MRSAWRLGLRASVVPLGLVALAAAACSTIDIVRGYNTGAHGTLGDPSVTPDDGAARLLRRMIVDELSSAYYQGGEGLAPWFEYAKRKFPGLVTKPLTEADGGPITPAGQEERFAVGGTHGRFQDVESFVRDGASEAPWVLALHAPKSHCASGTLSDAGQVFEDALRFQVSLVRAVQTARAWYRQGLLPDRSLNDGVNAGFDVAADYMKHRRFHRDPTRPNVGLVVSGGGSNGMFSAGAVWTLLNLIDGCMSTDCAPDPRFRLISGTSAGSMIAVVVDMFNAAWEDGQGNLRHAQGAGQQVLKQLAQWFTCLPAQQLYCSESDSSLSILSSRAGIVDFDGARFLLGQNVSDAMLANTSELLLNTFDFQSGALLAASDQNPADTRIGQGLAGRCDVVNHALSSIPEPFVANPVTLKDAGAGSGVGRLTPGFYLDGGVASVVPLMPVIRHGADKTIIVSSSPSIVGGAPPPVDSLDVLTNFINVAVSNNGEEGIAMGEAFANVQAAREQTLCEDICHKNGWPDCPTQCGDPLQNICSDGTKKPRGQNYPVAALYRNDSKILSATGYSFDPRQSLPLFLAGAAEVRGRCRSFASFLGIRPSASEPWCNQPMPTAAICDDASFWPLPQFMYSTKLPDKNNPDIVRTCDSSTWKNRPPACP